MVSTSVLGHWPWPGVQVWQLPHVPGQRGEPQARTVLAPALGTSAGQLPINRNERGRPELGGVFAGHDTGWSHSGSHLLVALVSHGRVGVDLERIQPRPKMAEVIARFFHPAEVAWLLGLDETTRQHWFFRVWCAKEALLKAHGHGISFGLHRFALLADGPALVLAESDPALGPPASWQLHEWAIADDFRAALAWQVAGACDNDGHEHPYPSR